MMGWEWSIASQTEIAGGGPAGGNEMMLKGKEKLNQILLEPSRAGPTALLEVVMATKAGVWVEPRPD